MDLDEAQRKYEAAKVALETAPRPARDASTDEWVAHQALRFAVDEAEREVTRLEAARAHDDAP